GRSERDSSEEAWTSELLVPGFGVETEPVPIQGFGAAAELMSVQITDQDRQEAEETMRRYDRDRNGMLSPEELARGRFGGNPLDFDRNGDGQLSVNELAIRYARRREVKEAQEAERRRDEARNRDRQPGEVKEVDLYQGRRSYRTLAARTLPEGTPGFFIDKDLNGDGQIEMAEFASEWSDDVVNEFFQWDLNRDGVITLEEARQAVEMGRQLSPAMQTSAAEQTSAAAPASTSSENTSSARAADQPVEPAADAAAAGDLPDEKLIRYAERIISRYDKNGDKALTASEWSGMLMSPAAADKNRDGRVTVLEYASWLQSRSKQ
ncbi:MAG: EF-hand domain-containing protein, partial [Novipirellula sp. JB048]